MIGHYLSNNNENNTIAFRKKIRHPNGALDSHRCWPESARAKESTHGYGIDGARLVENRNRTGTSMAEISCKKVYYLAVSYSLILSWTAYKLSQTLVENRYSILG